MKKGKDLLKLLIVAILFICSFVPVISDKALVPYPGPDGEILNQMKTYHYSMVQNLFDSGSGFLYIAFVVLALLTVVFTIMALAGKRTKKLSDIFFVLTVVLFVVIFAAALSVHRKF